MSYQVTLLKALELWQADENFDLGWYKMIHLRMVGEDRAGEAVAVGRSRPTVNGSFCERLHSQDVRKYHHKNEKSTGGPT